MLHPLFLLYDHPAQHTNAAGRLPFRRHVRLAMLVPAQQTDGGHSQCTDADGDANCDFCTVACEN